jgi:hypothetical protein
MKNAPIPFCLFCIIFLACHKETPIAPTPTPSSITGFSVLPSSRQYISPYLKKPSVVFEDSAGNQLVLKVYRTLNDTSTATIPHYNVHKLGDTVNYYYPFIADKIILQDDAKTYHFDLDLSQKFDVSNRDSIKTIDGLIIFLLQPSAHTYEYEVYFKVINLREDTPPVDYWPTNIVEPLRTFLGTTFLNVEHTPFGHPKAVVYYNTTYGIVAFSDYDNKIWRIKT